MRQLSGIKLYGTKVSKEGGAKLAAALPTTKVDVRRGGFLGIGIEPHPLGCVIIRVESKSVAARAGLEPGDVILSISGERPASFEELTKVIARFEPGEDVALQLYRDGERETLKVKLGEWE
jgi:S1-C subfamily serine protease